MEELTFVMSDMITVGHRLDQIKKHVFYGNEIKLEGRNLAKECELGIHRATGAINDNHMTHIAHGIIGKATESVELIEALYKHLYKGEKFDEVNVIEEIGDGQWYDALLLRVLNVSFAKAWSINIAKLYKRFKGEFSKDKALNRYLKIDRQVLE